MEESPWEANAHSPSQEIVDSFMEPKGSFCYVNKSPPLGPAASQVIAVHFFCTFKHNNQLLRLWKYMLYAADCSS
jgi:hypothetical protein